MKLKLFILAFTSLLLVSDILAGQDLPQPSIALEVSDFSEKMLTLSITNLSDEPQWLWDFGFSEGYYSTSILARSSSDLGGVCLFAPKMRGFMRDQPVTLLLPPNEPVEVTFVLEKWDITLEQMQNVSFLKVLLAVRETQESREFGVEHGFWESEWSKTDQRGQAGQSSLVDPTR